MKVIAVCGSPRKGGNTEKALTKVLEKVSIAGIDAELICLSGKNIRGCIACGQCRSKQDGLCYGVHDDLNDIIVRSREADAIILGTPVYFGSATPEIKAFIDRLGYTTRSQKVNTLKGKVGGAIAVARRAGQNFTLAQLSYFFSIMGMVQVGSTYWNILFGREKGDIESDEEGLKTLDSYTENLIWLLNKLHTTKYTETKLV